MNIFDIQNEINFKKKEIELLKKQLVDELNSKLKIWSNERVRDCYNIEISKKIMPEGQYILSGIECVEIWETGDADSEYAKDLYFPIELLEIDDTTKLIEKCKNITDKCTKLMKEKQSIAQKKKDEDEKKLYLKLKKKYDKI
jgi:hypothetical protein